MNLSATPVQLLESLDRRVLGAIRFIDAHSGLPVNGLMRIEGREATVVRIGGNTTLPFRPDMVRFIRNRVGLFVIERAPLFDDYTKAFLSPVAPDTLHGGILRLRLALVTVDPGYLPMEFDCDLPRTLTPGAGSVFTPIEVPLFRSPSARVENGWIILRARVRKSGSGDPLPGVLVRVFRSPRLPADAPIGLGISDWRSLTKGEAIVPVAGIQRFWPGSGAHVVETEQPVEYEAIRDPIFLGAADCLPHLLSLMSGTGRIIAPSVTPAVPAPAPVMNISVGKEYSVTLTMP